MATYSSILACRLPVDRGAWQVAESDMTEVTQHTAAAAAAAAAASLQLCPTLCNPIDGCPPGSAILGILQAIFMLPSTKP